MNSAGDPIGSILKHVLAIVVANSVRPKGPKLGSIVSFHVYHFDSFLRLCNKTPYVTMT